MALGNANASAQARGKNKATKIRKRKEIELAASFTAFSTTAAETSISNSCSISTSNMTEQYFHDGSHVSNLPYQVGDKVYTRKRENSKFYLANGFYKIGPDRGRYFSIKIVDGAVASITACP
tara:strand:- start:280 stop:645 length:366 start_codon:yes stop_codon:yes gene_type:complete